MIPAAAGLLACAACAGVLGNTKSVLVVSDRTEIRYREVPQLQLVNPNNPGGPVRVESQFFWDIETVPFAQLTAQNARFRYQLEYRPRIVFNDLEGKSGVPPFPPDLFHAATAAAAYVGKRFTLTLRDEFGLGQISLALFAGGAPRGAAPSVTTPPPVKLAPDPTAPPPPVNAAPVAPAVVPGTPPPTAQPLPTGGVQRLDIFNNVASLLLALSPSEKLGISAAARYLVEGGANAESRNILTGGIPMQQGPRLEAGFEYAFLPKWSVTGAASAIHSEITNGFFQNRLTEDITIDSADVDLGLRKRWTRSVGRIAGGASFVRFDPGTALPLNGQPRARFDPLSTYYPTANASYDWQPRSFNDIYLTLGANAALEPTVNRITGVVEQRVGGSLAAVARRDRTSFASAANGSRTVESGLDQASVLQVSETIFYNLHPYVVLDGGARFAWQQLGTQPIIFSQLYFVGVTVALKPFVL